MFICDDMGIIIYNNIDHIIGNLPVVIDCHIAIESILTNTLTTEDKEADVP